MYLLEAEHTVAPVYGSHDENTLSQFRNVLESAERGALMADGHLGYVMPIGGVAAYHNKISPVGVGFDIACGNMAIRLDVKTDQIKLNPILDRIEQEISFGIGQNNPHAPTNHPLFASDKWNAYDPKIRGELKKLAREQLGTVGAGNHYVDIFKDDEDYIWVGVHFGSRGLGHKTASGFMNLSQNRPWQGRAPEVEVLLDLDSDLGERYFTAMQLAGEYAYAGREWVCERVAKIIGADVIDWVHNHHNYAWKERHFGEEFVVVRKGATPAFPGQRSFVGGSMGDISVILKGIDGDESKTALYSTVHGAGRVMSRRKAAGKFKGWGKKRRQIKPGLIKKDEVNEILRKKGVKLRGGGLDEAPQVYRKLNDVLNEHQNTIEIEHRLKPLGVVMAGPDVYDPFRD